MGERMLDTEEMDRVRERSEEVLSRNRKTNLEVCADGRELFKLSQRCKANEEKEAWATNGSAGKRWRERIVTFTVYLTQT
jgi:hypothetical protein